jgi:leucyl-tRNA synthetase
MAGNKMICHCKQVDYLSIRKAMVQGARTIEEIQEMTGAGTACGRCIPELEKIYHKTVKKVTEDFEKLAFNTAISQMMIFVNAIYKEGKCPKAYADGFIKMLSCICPHIGEEIWSIMGHGDTIAYEPWPTFDESKTVDTTVTIAVQINGKLRSTIIIDKNDDKDSVIATAKADKKIADFLADKNIIKEIYVPGKIVNIVVK